MFGYPVCSDYCNLYTTAEYQQLEAISCERKMKRQTFAWFNIILLGEVDGVIEKPPKHSKLKVYGPTTERRISQIRLKPRTSKREFGRPTRIRRVMRSSGLLRSVDDSSLPTFRDTLSVPYSRIKKPNLFVMPEDGTDMLCRNVGKKLTLYAALNLKVDKVCAVRGYYSAYSGHSLRTFQDNLSVPSSRVKKSNKKAWISSSTKKEAVLDFFFLEDVTDR